MIQRHNNSQQYLGQSPQLVTASSHPADLGYKKWIFRLTLLDPAYFGPFKTRGEGISAPKLFPFSWTPRGSDLLKNGLTIKFSLKSSALRGIMKIRRFWPTQWSPYQTERFLIMKNGFQRT